MKNMNPEFYESLLDAIKNGYISVRNTPFKTEYTIEGAHQRYKLTSEFFAHNGKDVLIKYTLTMINIIDYDNFDNSELTDESVLFTETTSLLKSRSEKHSVKMLMKLCSARIVEIEKIRRQNNMFYSLISNNFEDIH